MGMLNAKVYANHKLGNKVKIKTHTGSDGAKQEMREAVDLNSIIKRYNQTGQMPGFMQSAPPVFADVSQFGDFASALRRVTAAQDTFAALPADIRSRFGNEAANLVAFIQDDTNYDEAVKLGIVEKKALPEPLPPPAAPVPPAPKP